MKHDLDQMLRNIEHTEPGAVFGVTLQGSPARPRPPRLARRLLPVASALLLLTLIVTLSIIALQREDTTPDLPPDDGENTLPPDTDPAPVDPAPWESGKLRVTSLTYRETRESAHFAPTDAPALTPLSEVSSTVQSENIAISLAFGTPISGCGNANLLRISPTEGEHADCDAVYYHIREDKIHCLSCTLKEEIAEHPLYLDAWVRAIIEEGVFFSHGLARRRENQEVYAALYQAIYDANVPAALAKGNTVPSAADLGIAEILSSPPADGTLRSEALINNRLSTAPLTPQIEVISYGTEHAKCLFSLILSNEVSRYSQGTYLYDFEAAALTRLEGSSIGIAYCVSSDCDSSAPYNAYDFTRALGIQYVDGYAKMVATLPWQMPGFATYYVPILFDTETGIASPLFFPHDPVRIGEYTPEQPVTMQEGWVICRLSDKGAYHFFDLKNTDTKIAFGSRTAEMTLEALFAIGGEHYVRMHIAANKSFPACVHYFRLSDGTRVTPLFEDGTLVAPDYTYYSYQGTKRTDTRTGETISLYDGDVLASVCSADEKYLYIFPSSADRIVCINRHTGDTGEIALSPQFTAQLSVVTDAKYTLCLDQAESSLTVVFTATGHTFFDKDAFLSSDYEKGFRTRLLAGDFAEAMAYAAERMLPYYRQNGRPLALVGRERVAEALTLLCLQELDALGDAPIVGAQLLPVAAEKLLPYLSYEGMTATVTAADLAKLKKSIDP